MKDGEVKNKLSPAQISVMQHQVTEPPYFGKYWDHVETGRYRCAACDTPLFSSDDKFNSKTGWPSFKKPLSERDLQFKSEPGPDDKVEIRCKKCKSHLGYVIAGETPYYRINSVCLNFEAIVTPAADSNTKSLAAVPVAQEPVTLLDTATPSTTRSSGSLISGIIIGVLVGAGATAYFMQPLPTLVPETATSTADFATSTAESPTTVDEERTEVAPEPVLSDEPPPQIQSEALAPAGTSTQ